MKFLLRLFETNIQMTMEMKITSCETIKQKTRRDTESPLIKN